MHNPMMVHRHQPPQQPMQPKPQAQPQPQARVAPAPVVLPEALRPQSTRTQTAGGYGGARPPVDISPSIPGYSGPHGSALDFNAPAVSGLKIEPRKPITPYENGKDHWSCIEDTDWYLVKIADTQKLTALKELADPECTDSVVKFLCKRYEEITDERVFEHRQKCAAVDSRNKTAYIANAKLCARLTDNILKPLYQKPLTVPHYPEYEKEAADRWAKYCAQDKIKITLAVKYLKEKHNKIAEVDYEIENVVDTCNDLAFADAIKAEIAKHNGHIPIRIPGQRPAKWDGVSETDNRGMGIRWKRPDDFSFINPVVSFEFYSVTGITVRDDDDTLTHNRQ
jgi:hypothetical protein